MGGCYSSSYGFRETQREPQWQTDVAGGLRKFFSTRDTTFLIGSYNAFSVNNKSGFIKAVMKHQGITEGLKEFPEIEYELKLDIRLTPPGAESAEPTVAQYLDAFEFPPGRIARFLKDEVNAVAVGTNHFFGKGNDERLVVIEKGGKLYLKEKSQPLPLKTGVQHERLVVKRTEDRYEADLGEVIDNVGEALKEGATYRGSIVKDKGDAFVLGTRDGRIYSFTVTRSQRNDGNVQRQLEIEYAGHIPGFPNFTENSEAEIVEGLVAVAKHTVLLSDNLALPGGYRMSLAPTNERKFDFVSGAKAPKSMPLERLMLATRLSS